MCLSVLTCIFKTKGRKSLYYLFVSQLCSSVKKSIVGIIKLQEAQT